MPIHFHCGCGKPFWTADANAGRRMACTRCGQELDIPLSTTRPDRGIVFIEGPAARTHGKAIASLVVGGLAFIPCLVASATMARYGRPVLNEPVVGIPLFFGLLLGIMGLSLGNSARTVIARSLGRFKGRGLANCGSLMGVASFLGSFVFLFGCVGVARESARRAQCVGNLKQVGLAFLNYQEANEIFPPATITDTRGKPLLSWRVALLPWIERQDLYERFKLDEPWDSPHNLTLLREMPLAYRCPSNVWATEGTTPYQLIIGPAAIYEGNGPPSDREIPDGASETFLVVEGKALVPWTKPEDVDLRSIGSALGSEHARGFNAAFADGSVRYIRPDAGPMGLHARATKAGGEVVDPH